MADPYAIFGVTPNCPDVELKKRYQELLLRFHPDKTLSTKDRKPTGSCLEMQSLSPEENFRLLEEAWSVLRNPDARRSFDVSKSQAEKRQPHPVGDTVKLYDMEQVFEDETTPGRLTGWCHPCRCGAEYFLDVDYEAVFSKETLDTSHVLVCCEDCSLAISVDISQTSKPD